MAKEESDGELSCKFLEELVNFNWPTAVENSHSYALDERICEISSFSRDDRKSILYEEEAKNSL